MKNTVEKITSTDGRFRAVLISKEIIGADGMYHLQCLGTGWENIGKIDAEERRVKFNYADDYLTVPQLKSITQLIDAVDMAYGSEGHSLEEGK